MTTLQVVINEALNTEYTFVYIYIHCVCYVYVCERVFVLQILALCVS